MQDQVWLLFKQYCIISNANFCQVQDQIWLLFKQYRIIGIPQLQAEERLADALEHLLTLLLYKAPVYRNLYNIFKSLGSTFFPLKKNATKT